MANTFTELNPGAGGSAMDETGVTYGTAPTVRKRARIVIAGVTPDEIAAVTNAAPSSTAYGLVVRAVDGATETTLAALSNKFSTLGQKTSAASVPVVLPTDQSELPVRLVADHAPVDVSLVAFNSDVISTANSFNGTLTAGQVFTGVWEDVTGFAGISAIILATTDSAVNGAKAQFSHDGVSVLREIPATIVAAAGGAYFSFAPEAKYFRVTYTNGATSADVKSQVIYRTSTPADVQLPAGATVSDVSLASVHRALISGRLPSGVYKPLASTDAGELKIANVVGAGTMHPEVAAPSDESSVSIIAAGTRKGLAIHNSSTERTLICSVGTSGGKAFSVRPMGTIIFEPAPTGAIYGYWTFGTAGGGATATEW